MHQPTTRSTHPTPVPPCLPYGQIVWRLGVVVLLVLAALSWWAEGRGYKTWAFRKVNPTYAALARPSVTVTRPARHEGNVSTDAFVAADVNLPNMGRVVDGHTLSAKSVRLLRTRDRRPVPAVVNTTAAG